MVDQQNIIINGAREHNLKSISVSLPRNKFIIITGLSGSGKSSLAFDTSYAEGLEKNYLDFLEENVTGHTHFKKKNKKTKRTKWETINNLYKDLKYNQMQKQFPFYYSEKGDSTMLNLFQKIDEEKE